MKLLAVIGFVLNTPGNGAVEVNAGDIVDLDPQLATELELAGRGKLLDKRILAGAEPWAAASSGEHVYPTASYLRKRLAASFRQ